MEKYSLNTKRLEIMNIKLKYRAWVSEKHIDISNSLTNSDIETFAIEFAYSLINDHLPNVIEDAFAK
jgi:hypothetical protein